MTNQQKREQWRFYFAVYFQEATPAHWKEGREKVVEKAALFADQCVGAEEKRFADLRPDPSPVAQPSGPSTGAPYR